MHSNTYKEFTFLLCLICFVSRSLLRFLHLFLFLLHPFPSYSTFLRMGANQFHGRFAIHHCEKRLSILFFIFSFVFSPFAFLPFCFLSFLHLLFWNVNVWNVQIVSIFLFSSLYFFAYFMRIFSRAFILNLENENCREIKRGNNNVNHGIETPETDSLRERNWSLLLDLLGCFSQNILSFPFICSFPVHSLILSYSLLFMKKNIAQTFYWIYHFWKCCILRAILLFNMFVPETVFPSFTIHCIFVWAGRSMFPRIYTEYSATLFSPCLNSVSLSSQYTLVGLFCVPILSIFRHFSCTITS